MFDGRANTGLILALSFATTIISIFASDCPAFAEGPHLNAKQIAKLRTMAEKGNPAAQTSLGAAYLYGWGMEKNEAEAIGWYRKAADQGQSLAQFDMGEACRNGLGGTPKDDNEAVKWFRKSAEQGNVFGQGNLAMAYHTGFGGLTKDDVQAYMWNSLAVVEKKNLNAAKLNVELEQSMTPAEIAEAKALAKKWKKQHPNIRPTRI